MTEPDQLELLKEPAEAQSYFCDPANQISMRTLSNKPNTGFRPGQLGALHSTIAHFSVNEDPAVISLPTGYGKTAVIMALPFAFNARHVLVVEPTDVLRRQTASHFKTLHTLRKLSVLPEGAANPAVWSIKGYPADWHRFEKYDVLISTPNSSSPIKDPKPPADFFDLVIFDEAHHAPADTWAAYLSYFTGARFVFLTATPFRRDKKVIPGKLAYRYPVSKAAREKAFGKVRFVAAP